MTTARRLRPLALAAGAVAIAALLAGCVDPAPEPGASSSRPTPSASSGQTGTPSASPTPSATPTSTPAEPIDVSCEALVPLQALYDLDPNLALLTDVAPTLPAAVQAVADGGVSCTLVHTSTGATIELAVSSPGSVALEQARAAAGSPVDLGIAGVDGFESGTAVQAFTATLRYSAESATGGTSELAPAIAIPIAAMG